MHACVSLHLCACHCEYGLADRGMSTSVDLCDLYSFSSCQEQDAEQVCNLDCVGVEECGGSVSAGENCDQTIKQDN